MPRSEAPKDPRPYVRIAEDFLDNRKLDDIDDPLAYVAHLAAVIASAKSMTDGHFRIRNIQKRYGIPDHIVDAMVKQDAWHLPGHDCPKCPQPKAGEAYVHDYLEHQRSVAEIRGLSEKRRAAGQAGAAARWGTPVADAMASAKQVPSHKRGKPMAEERRGEEIPPPPPSGDAGGFTPEWTARVVERALTIRPDWTAADVRKALANPRVRQRPPDIVERTLLLVAADDATDRASRLGANHGYWSKARQEAAAERRRAATQIPPHPFRPDESGSCPECPLPSGHAIHRTRTR